MVTLMVNLVLEEYAAWEERFDALEGTREEYGQRRQQVFRGVENPNRVVLMLDWDDVEGVREYSNSDEFLEGMAGAGYLEESATLLEAVEAA